MSRIARGAQLDGVLSRPALAAVRGLVRPVRATPLAERIPGKARPPGANGGGVGHVLCNAPPPPVSPFGGPGGGCIGKLLEVQAATGADGTTAYGLRARPRP